MPNFIHSLDASCIHELTNDLIEIIKNKNEDLLAMNNLNSRKENNIRLFNNNISKFIYYNDNPSDFLNKDNTYFDYDSVKDMDFNKIGIFKNTIPLYTIHDCFASTADNMCLIKNNLTTLFSEMYFSDPFLKKLHVSLLNQINSYFNVYAYPMEYTEDWNIKEFKSVKINEENILDFKDIIMEKVFENSYYLFIVKENNDLKEKIELIPSFPPLINENIQKYRQILRRDSINSSYLIS